MNTANTCPICGFVQTEEGRNTCSQCDADLVCFRLLDTLSPPSPPSESEQQHPSLPECSDDGEPCKQSNGSLGEKDAGKTVPKTWRWMILVLTMLLLMVLSAGYAAHRFKILTAAVQALTNGLQKTTAEVETHQRQMADITRFSQNAQDTLTRLDSRVGKAVFQLERRIKQADKKKRNTGPPLTEKRETDKSMVLNRIKAPQSKTGPAAPETTPPAVKPCLKTYQATDTDTLWTISRDLYGSGAYYPVLMAYNPNLDIFNLSSRHTIAHPCNKTTAAAIYQRITAVKDNRWFWKYRVRAGDTPQSIAKRFCSNPTDCFVDAPPFEPGTTIGIYLE